MKHGKINIILGKCHGPILRRDTIDLISISDIDFLSSEPGAAVQCLQIDGYPRRWRMEKHLGRVRMPI